MMYDILVPENVLLYQNLIAVFCFSSNGYARRSGTADALNITIGTVLHSLLVAHTFAFHNLITHHYK